MFLVKQITLIRLQILRFEFSPYLGVVIYRKSHCVFSVDVWRHSKSKISTLFKNDNIRSIFTCRIYNLYFITFSLSNILAFNKNNGTF